MSCATAWHRDILLTHAFCVGFLSSTVLLFLPREDITVFPLLVILVVVVIIVITILGHLGSKSALDPVLESWCVHF